ncbi:MAG: ribosomal L7Ae/L30e/S12e/Gadd45 family protein [Clostridia bacterium]|nr:ribosomal L7Ae/L30e/S12e/Gadd45 family protein [Clostridia bacterium]
MKSDGMNAGAGATGASEVSEVNERFFGMLGMSRRAGKTVVGAELVVARMRGKSKPDLVLISDAASENTKNRMTAKCDFYGVPRIVVAVGGEELSRRLGKTGFTAVVAVTDPGLAREIANACTCKGRESPTDGDGSTGNRG